MNKEKYNKIIDDAYAEYENHFMGHEDIPNKQLFLLQCEVDKKFSERWGLQVHTRDLSLQERFELWEKLPNRNVMDFPIGPLTDEQCHEVLTKLDIPIQIIKITNNNETIEFYEG